MTYIDDQAIALLELTAASFNSNSPQTLTYLCSYLISSHHPSPFLLCLTHQLPTFVGGGGSVTVGQVKMADREENTTHTT